MCRSKYKNTQFSIDPKFKCLPYSSNISECNSWENWGSTKVNARNSVLACLIAWNWNSNSLPSDERNNFVRQQTKIVAKIRPLWNSLKGNSTHMMMSLFCVYIHYKLALNSAQKQKRKKHAKSDPQAPLLLPVHKKRTEYYSQEKKNPISLSSSPSSSSSPLPPTQLKFPHLQESKQGRTSRWSCELVWYPKGREKERERRSEYNIEAAKFTRKKGIQLIAAAAAADDHQSSWGEEAPAVLLLLVASSIYGLLAGWLASTIWWLLVVGLVNLM